MSTIHLTLLKNPAFAIPHEPLLRDLGVWPEESTGDPLADATSAMEALNASGRLGELRDALDPPG